MHVAGKPSWISSMLHGRRCPAGRIAMLPLHIPVCGSAQHLIDPADKPFLDAKLSGSSPRSNDYINPAK